MYSVYPHDAISRGISDAPCVRLSVSPSITNRCCNLYRSGRTDRAGFPHVGFSFDLSYPTYTVLERGSHTSKNKGTVLWNFVSDAGLGEIAPRHVERRNVLST